MKITIDKAGTAKFIYKDELRPLLNEGDASIKRASHVEPTPDNKWTADMIGFGVVLGPFDTREEALKAEQVFLEERLGQV